MQRRMATRHTGAFACIGLLLLALFYGLGTFSAEDGAGGMEPGSPNNIIVGGRDAAPTAATTVAPGEGTLEALYVKMLGKVPYYRFGPEEAATTMICMHGMLQGSHLDWMEVARLVHEVHPEWRIMVIDMFAKEGLRKRRLRSPNPNPNPEPEAEAESWWGFVMRRLKELTGHHQHTLARVIEGVVGIEAPKATRTILAAKSAGGAAALKYLGENPGAHIDRLILAAPVARSRAKVAALPARLIQSTLVLWCEDDPVVHPTIARWYSEIGANVKMFPEGGHSITEAMRPTILGFLERPSPSLYPNPNPGPGAGPDAEPYADPNPDPYNARER